MMYFRLSESSFQEQAPGFDLPMSINCMNMACLQDGQFRGLGVPRGSWIGLRYQWP